MYTQHARTHAHTHTHTQTHITSRGQPTYISYHSVCIHHSSDRGDLFRSLKLRPKKGALCRSYHITVCVYSCLRRRIHVTYISYHSVCIYHSAGNTDKLSEEEDTCHITVCVYTIVHMYKCICIYTCMCRV